MYELNRSQYICYYALARCLTKLHSRLVAMSIPWLAGDICVLAFCLPNVAVSHLLHDIVGQQCPKMLYCSKASCCVVTPWFIRRCGVCNARFPSGVALTRRPLTQPNAELWQLRFRVDNAIALVSSRLISRNYSRMIAREHDYSLSACIAWQHKPAELCSTTCGTGNSM